MKIAIDTTSLASGHSGRGIGVYTKCLLENLGKFFPENEYIPFSGKYTIQIQADIVHYPSFEPFFITLPISLPVPFVVTIHDLTPIALPKLFPLGVKGRLKWEIQRKLVLGARRIITDSLHSKNDVIKFCGFPEDRIDPIYLAPREVFLNVQNGKNRIHKFPYQYFLYVGDVNRNKNILGLLHAYSIFRKEIKNSSIPKLILIGKAFINNRIAEVNEIEATIKQFNLDEYVIRPGFIEDADLAGVYHNAIATIQPSLYEGFGFPVVEAMACGCPVISTNAGSLKEVAGPSIVVSPDAESLARGMNQAASLKKSQRNELIHKGKEWVEQFSWKRVASETIESYKKAVLAS